MPVTVIPVEAPDAVKFKMDISSPSTSVSINAALELPSKAAVTPEVPATLLIAFFSSVRSDAEVTVAEIAAVAEPPRVKVTVPVPTEVNLAWVAAVAVIPVEDVASLTSAAINFTESCGGKQNFSAPLCPEFF
jgi:hypothetical protein